MPRKKKRNLAAIVGNSLFKPIKWGVSGLAATGLTDLTHSYVDNNYGLVSKILNTAGLTGLAKYNAEIPLKIHQFVEQHPWALPAGYAASSALALYGVYRHFQKKKK